MNPHLIYYPVFAMIVLTMVVLLRMFLLRLNGIREGKIDVRYFKTYDMPVTLPVLQTQAVRNFTNLFEVPTLFYVVCAFGLITENVDKTFLTLAWIYVGTRVLHSFIHLTSNKIIARMSFYALSLLILLIMATKLALSVA